MVIHCDLNENNNNNNKEDKKSYTILWNSKFKGGFIGFYGIVSYSYRISISCQGCVVLKPNLIYEKVDICR